jgi:hypothetical protein
VPTPDPALVTSALTTSGVTFNGIWPYAAALIAAGGGFVLARLGLHWGTLVLNFIRRIGR